MIPPTPPVPSCPLLDAKCVEAGARAAYRMAFDFRPPWPSWEELSTGVRGAYILEIEAALTTAIAALDRDELAVLIEGAIADETNADDGLTTYAQLACAVLAAIGLLPGEEPR